MKRYPDYVISRKDGSEFYCEHCGMTYDVHHPCPLDVYVGLAKAFLQMHRVCVAKQEVRE